MLFFLSKSSGTDETSHAVNQQDKYQINMHDYCTVIEIGLWLIVQPLKCLTKAQGKPVISETKTQTRNDPVSQLCEIYANRFMLCALPLTMLQYKLQFKGELESTGAYHKTSPLHSAMARISTIYAWAH